VDQTQSTGQTSNGQYTQGMKRTLNLTSLLVNAMALIAPGAFLWTTFQMQAAQTNGGITTAGEMWTGLFAALILAFLTAISYSELANIYPKAGTGSSYYYAEAAFLEKAKAAHRQWARVAKFLTGWISHLYYWIYPGIMVAFSAILIVYIVGLFGITLAPWEQIIVAVVFAVVNGYIAYRGITGSTMTAMIINAIQLAALVVFSVLAILYRQAHPALAYTQSISTVLIPHNLTNMIFQSTIAILLLVGFESITSLGSEAINPKKDIRNAILLALVIQGAFAYLLEYFAANYFVGPQMIGTNAGVTVTGYAQSAASGAPIGDMIRIIGDQMLGGNGFLLVLIMAATVVLALIGTTLACLNTAVRVTYAMGKDKEMPSIMGLLHGRFATPHWNIWILVAVSAIFGAYGVLSVDNMTQITWASNIGTFMLYGLTNLIALWAFLGRPNSSILRHKLVPIAGFLANLLMLVAVLYIGASAGGSSATDAIIALAMVAVWMVVGIVWFVFNTYKQGRKILIRESTQLTHEDLRENIT